MGNLQQIKETLGVAVYPQIEQFSSDIPSLEITCPNTHGCGQAIGSQCSKCGCWWQLVWHRPPGWDSKICHCSNQWVCWCLAEAFLSSVFVLFGSYILMQFLISSLGAPALRAAMMASLQGPGLSSTPPIMRRVAWQWWSISWEWRYGWQLQSSN